jgi:uncharacterized protein (UPF0332 family)
MKKVSFLIKLKIENKIRLVNPSEEIKEAYFKKSDKSLNSAKVLTDIGNFEDAVALIYYSMYYNILALLFRIGIKCENHTGAIMLLKDIFSIYNAQVFNAKKERVDKQYYIDSAITKKEVNDMIRTAEEFNNELINFIDTLNSDKIKNYRNIAINLIK